jgi:hypothetical protein
VPKNKRAYKSAKRNKEIQRLKKQEEKRQKRLGNLIIEPEPGAEPAAPVDDSPVFPVPDPD